MKINVITLFVERPQEVREWYQTKLGLAALPGGPLLMTDEEGPMLNFLHGRQDHPEQIQLHFEVPDVDAFYQELTAKGVSFSEPPKVMPWGWRHAYTQDPAGHTVEIVSLDDQARARLAAARAAISQS